MSDRFPTFSPSEQGSIADLHTVWEQRALTWSNYKGQFDKKLRACSPYIIINGKQCYGLGFAFSANAIANPWNSPDHPHVQYLKVLGMTDEQIQALYYSNLEPAEVETLWHKWQNPNVGRTLTMGNAYYAEIIALLSDVTKITLEGENIAYYGTELVRPELTNDLNNLHSYTALHINETDYDLYDTWIPKLFSEIVPASASWLDRLLEVKLYNSLDEDITPVNKPLLDAVRALVLLESSFATLTSTTKVSEREVVGEEGYESQFFVTSRMTYDYTPTEFLNIEKFLHTTTETYDEVVEEVLTIQSIWKNYFWKFREPDSDEEDLALQSEGILTLYDGRVYLTVDGLFRASDRQFEEIIAPAMNIYSELKNLAIWKKFLVTIGELLAELYGGIYNLLKHIPYFKHKEEQLIDYLVKYGDPLHNREFTREEAEVYMEGVGKKAIGITISIVLLFATFGTSSEASILAWEAVEVGVAIGASASALAIIYTAVLSGVIALEIGLMAYTSYIGAEADFEGYILDEQFRELEELEEQARDEAKDAVETATVGTMGDIGNFELQNYILYHGIYNEKFENQLEHLNPFDRDGEFKPKYKQGG